MLPPTPRQNRRVRSRDFSTLRVADFYMGPSNDAARLSVPPTCPVGQSTASLPRRGFAPAQTSATSRITRFSWQQPHVRLIAIATSAAWSRMQFQTAALSHTIITISTSYGVQILLLHKNLCHTWRFDLSACHPCRYASQQRCEFDVRPVLGRNHPAIGSVSRSLPRLTARKFSARGSSTPLMTASRDEASSRAACQRRKTARIE